MIFILVDFINWRLIVIGGVLSDLAFRKFKIGGLSTNLQVVGIVVIELSTEKLMPG